MSNTDNQLMEKICSSLPQALSVFWPTDSQGAKQKATSTSREVLGPLELDSKLTGFKSPFDTWYLINHDGEVRSMNQPTPFC